MITVAERGKYFSQIADTLNGLVVIRCLEKVDFMLKQFHNHQVINHKVINFMLLSR